MVDLDELRRLLAKPCCDECVVKAMRNVLPALLAEAEAGRKLRDAADRVHERLVYGWPYEDLESELGASVREYDAAVAKEPTE